MSKEDLREEEEEEMESDAEEEEQEEEMAGLGKRRRSKSTGDSKGKKKFRKRKPLVLDENSKEGVIYLGHIPHGFFEEQMREFFSQFGTILHLRLSRSKKTANSRGYAFIQFEDQEVANVVQRTMNQYILLGSTLVCKLVPPERVHPRIFVYADRPFKKIPWYEFAVKKFNSTNKSEKSKASRLDRLLRTETKQKERLASLGFDLGDEFPGYKVESAPTLAAAVTEEVTPEMSSGLAKLASEIQKQKTSTTSKTEKEEKPLSEKTPAKSTKTKGKKTAETPKVEKDEEPAEEEPKEKPKSTKKEAPTPKAAAKTPAATQEKKKKTKKTTTD